MNKQRREHSHPSYVCFSAAHDFAVGDVGVVFKISFIISYTKKNNMAVIDKILLLAKEHLTANDSLRKFYAEKKIVCDVTKFA